MVQCVRYVLVGHGCYNKVSHRSTVWVVWGVGQSARKRIHPWHSFPIPIGLACTPSTSLTLSCRQLSKAGKAVEGEKGIWHWMLSFVVPLAMLGLCVKYQDCLWKGKWSAIVKARVFSCSNSLFYHLISYQIAERYRGDRRWRMKMTKQISFDLCPEIFTSRRGLSYHKQLHRGVKIKKYNCLQCNKSFSTNSNLNIHSLIHSGERPHECTQCNFLCSDPSYFRRHIKNTWLKK